MASTRTARDINRRIVLNLIRKHQPVSRAEISRHTGMQRSTVSAITEQLIAERWVTIGAFGDLPRGRKPTFLHFNSDRAGIVGVDVRPVETTIILADLEMRFLARERISTVADPAVFISTLCQSVRKLIASNPHISCEGIGVALPGRIDLSTNRLVFAPNLGLYDVDFKKPLEQATGLPVELENAANACALAELWSAAKPRGVRNLVAITVSEGIGVGMILNGQLVRGTTGLAGEFGHITIQEDGPPCSCGKRGCWEACASNTATIRYFNEAKSKRGAKPTFDSILKLAEQGDRDACEALDLMARSLGVGIAIIAAGLAPDVILLVGEVTRAWKQLETVVKDVIRLRLPTGAKPQIVASNPSAQPRLRGSIALVLQKHFGSLCVI